MGNVSTTYVDGTGNTVTLSNKQRAAAAVGATGKSLASKTPGNDLDDYVSQSFAESLAADQTELYHEAQALGTTTRITKGDVTKIAAMTKGEAINHQSMLLDVARNLHTTIMNASDDFMKNLEMRFATPETYGFDPQIIEGAFNRADSVELTTPALAVQRAQKSHSIDSIRSAISALSLPADPSKVRAKSEIVSACSVRTELAGTLSDAHFALTGPLKLKMGSGDAYATLSQLGSEVTGAAITVVSGGVVNVDPYADLLACGSSITADRDNVQGLPGIIPEQGAVSIAPAGTSHRHLAFSFANAQGETVSYDGKMLFMDLSAQKQSAVGRLLRHAGSDSDIRMTLDGTVRQRGFVAANVGVCPIGTDSGTGVYNSFAPGEIYLTHGHQAGNAPKPTTKPLGRASIMRGTLVVCRSPRQVNMDSRGEFKMTVLTTLPIEGVVSADVLYPNYSPSINSQSLQFNTPVVYADVPKLDRAEVAFISGDANNGYLGAHAKLSTPIDIDSWDKSANWVVQATTYSVDWHIRARLFFGAEDGVYAFVVPDPTARPFDSGIQDPSTTTIKDLAPAVYTPVEVLSRGAPFSDAASAIESLGENTAFAEFIPGGLGGTYRAEIRNHANPECWMAIKDANGVLTYTDAEVTHVPGQTPARGGMAYSAVEGLLDAIPTLGNINPRYFSALLTQSEWTPFYIWARANGNKSV